MAERPATREGPQNLKKKSVEASIDLRTFTQNPLRYLHQALLSATTNTL